MHSRCNFVRSSLFDSAHYIALDEIDRNCNANKWKQSFAHNNVVIRFAFGLRIELMLFVPRKNKDMERGARKMRNKIVLWRLNNITVCFTGHSEIPATRSVRKAGIKRNKT